MVNELVDIKRPAAVNMARLHPFHWDSGHHPYDAVVKVPILVEWVEARNRIRVSELLRKIGQNVVEVVKQSSAIINGIDVRRFRQEDTHSSQTDTDWFSWVVYAVVAVQLPDRLEMFCSHRGCEVPLSAGCP